jgi:hypothetical protein
MYTPITGRKTFKHLYMIPTKKGIDRCVDSCLHEIETTVSEKHLKRDDIALVVVEDGTNATAQSNSDVLLNRQRRGMVPCHCIHIMPDEVSTYIETVCGFDQRLLNLFLRRNDNHGRIANLLSLIAVSFNATFLHKRDIHSLLSYNFDSMQSPLAAELSYFKSNTQEYLLIGSNYPENTDVDTSGFLPLPHISDGNQPSQLPNDEYQIGVPGADRNPALSASRSTTSVTHGLWPDMGNSACKNIFRQYSFPPHANTPGSDFSFIHIGESVNVPMALHNQRTHHPSSYDSYTRRNPDVYYLMLARCIDYYTIYLHLPKYRPEENVPPSRHIADSLKRLGSRSLPLIPERCRKIASFAEQFLKLGGETGKRIHQSIKHALPEILRSNDRFINEHAYLQDRWELLVNRAA